MSTATFDKLLFLETLKAAGVPEEQARAHAHALDEALRDSVATKADITALRTEMQTGFQLLEHRMTIKLGGMLLALAGILLAAMRYLPPHP